MRKITRFTLAAMAAAILTPVSSFATTVSFSTFVSSSSINSVEGQNNTIAYNFAGNEFVGSVYFGSNNLQLYSTNLTGGNVQKFGSPIPNGFSGEVVVGASLGQAGFPSGDIYAGAGSQIYHYPNASGSGTAPTLFATLTGQTVRQVFFDPGSSFAGNMLVTTTSGNIYKINSSGVATLLASVGEDTEGIDIATTAWGSFAGDLLVSSEGSGLLRLISPTGTVTVINPNNPIALAETVSFVPLNLGASGSSLEGFYVANYPVDIQFAAASEFSGLLGDAIVTEEFSSSSPLWDVHFNTATGGFNFTQLTGTLPNQSEDGIFVTSQRIQDLGTPEPSTLLTLGTGLLGCLGVLRRKLG